MSLFKPGVSGWCIWIRQLDAYRQIVYICINAYGYMV